MSVPRKGATSNVAPTVKEWSDLRSHCHTRFTILGTSYCFKFAVLLCNICMH